MARQSYPLKTEQDKQRAHQAIDAIDLDAGKSMSITSGGRTGPQNDRMWAMLADISRQVEWYGQKLKDEEWKHVFSAAVQQQRVVPGLDGCFVVLGVSTSKQSKRWFNDMFLVMEAFAAERGVKFSTADHWGVTA